MTTSLISPFRWKLLFGLGFLMVCLCSTAGTASTLNIVDGQLPSITEEGSGLSLDLAAGVVNDQQGARARLIATNPLPSSLDKFASPFTLYIDTGLVEAESDDIAFGSRVSLEGQPVGAGLVALLPQWHPRFNAALHINESRGNSEVQDNIALRGSQVVARYKDRNMSAAILLSPTGSNQARMKYQFSLGIRRFKSNYNVSTGATLQPSLSKSTTDYFGFATAGIQYPVGRINFYAVIGHDEYPFATLGLRLQ